MRRTAHSCKIRPLYSTGGYQSYLRLRLITVRSDRFQVLGAKKRTSQTSANRHGITLSAWAFAGLTGNQMASFIVNHFGNPVEHNGVMVNPTGYQNVLIVTLVLYAVALCLSLFLVRPTKKDK